MKNIFLALLILTSTFITNAQYSSVYKFTGEPSASEPSGSLIYDGTYLYGVTQYGGVNDLGTVFRVRPNGTGFSKLLDFAGISNGERPSGTLATDGAFLYGMTYAGGANNQGLLYKLKTDGTSFSKLIDFSGAANGSFPSNNSLIFDGTYLYGTVRTGGTNGNGVIFKIKPDGTGYLKLFDFSPSTSGGVPLGSLVSDGTFLYGTTWAGGINGYGTLYKIKPDGTGFLKLLDFSGVANGKNPDGSIHFDGSFLYVTAPIGGTNDSGVLFKIKADGTGFSKLRDFGADGHYPRGSLISDGAFLYGLTMGDGQLTDWGTIFKIKPDGTGYSTLYSFRGPVFQDGGSPQTSLVSDGNFLYGTTSEGGLGVGMIFKYGVVSGIEEDKETAGLAIYPNPATNYLFIAANDLVVNEISIYSATGSLLSQSKEVQSKNIDISQLAPGMYIAEIKTGEVIVRRRWMKL